MDDNTRNPDKSSVSSDNKTDLPSSQTEEELVKNAPLTSKDINFSRERECLNLEDSSEKKYVERSLKPPYSKKTSQESDRIKSAKASSVESITRNPKPNELLPTGEDTVKISLASLTSAAGINIDHHSSAKHVSSRKRPKTVSYIPDRKNKETLGAPVASDCSGMSATGDMSTRPSTTAVINRGHDSPTKEASSRKRSKTVSSIPDRKIKETPLVPVASDFSGTTTTRVLISTRTSTSAAVINRGHNSPTKQVSPRKKPTGDYIFTKPSNSPAVVDRGHDSPTKQVSPRKKPTGDSISARPSTSSVINRGHDSPTKQASPRRSYKTLPSIPGRKTEESPKKPAYRYILPKPSTSAAVKNLGYENPVYDNPVHENPVHENPVYDNPVYENLVYENPEPQEPSEVHYKSVPVLQLEISTINFPPPTPLKRDVGTNTEPHICAPSKVLKRDVATNTEPEIFPLHNQDSTALCSSYIESDQTEERVINPEYSNIEFSNSWRMLIDAQDQNPTASNTSYIESDQIDEGAINSEYSSIHQNSIEFSNSGRMGIDLQDQNPTASNTSYIESDQTDERTANLEYPNIGQEPFECSDSMTDFLDELEVIPNLGNESDSPDMVNFQF